MGSGHGVAGARSDASMLEEAGVAHGWETGSRGERAGEGGVA